MGTSDANPVPVEKSGIEGVSEEHNRTLYLDLMRRSLLNLIYGRAEERAWSTTRTVPWRWIGRALEAFGVVISWPRPIDLEKRLNGIDWPPTAHTMVGLKRLENIEFCVRDVVANNIPGDFIETGVWRGGSTIFMRAVLKSLNVTDRRVWVADSFQGQPVPNAEKYPADRGRKGHTRRRLRVTLEDVQENFKGYGLLDDQVQFLKGWFKDTLPSAPIERLAIARLDGDLYESTMDALASLYPKLSVGGYLIIDDYGAIGACRQAVQDYFKQNDISVELTPIDWTGVYCKRLS